MPLPSPSCLPSLQDLSLPSSSSSLITDQVKTTPAKPFIVLNGAGGGSMEGAFQKTQSVSVAQEGRFRSIIAIRLNLLQIAPDHQPQSLRYVLDDDGLVS